MSEEEDREIVHKRVQGSVGPIRSLCRRPGYTTARWKSVNCPECARGRSYGSFTAARRLRKE